MQVNAEQYRNRVQSHLRRYRPKQYRQAKREGYLNRNVTELVQAIADWVNSQLPPANPDEPLEQQIKKRETALLMAESDALRELLPMDESEEAKIGPSGGYED